MVLIRGFCYRNTPAVRVDKLATQSETKSIYAQKVRKIDQPTIKIQWTSLSCRTIVIKCIKRYSSFVVDHTHNIPYSHFSACEQNRKICFLFICKTKKKLYPRFAFPTQNLPKKRIIICDWCRILVLKAIKNLMQNVIWKSLINLVHFVVGLLYLIMIFSLQWETVVCPHTHRWCANAFTVRQNDVRMRNCSTLLYENQWNWTTKTYVAIINGMRIKFKIMNDQF